MGGRVGVPLKALFLVSIISNTEINIYFYFILFYFWSTV